MTMPARLKSFELHGYKTFASRNEFVFSDGITAIVGPNGSGKSNIADALRWVLGEQSYGLLRAKKTEDMIFSGSENRPRAGMASATIVFDNTDGWLPIDFTEVGITRRAFRDGENEYLLNGQRVRLKDVSEVLAKSGLAERTYTIIGQVLVDAALALKAEDRRRLFEEAAGIGLHRSRREEALKRLDTTSRNLERVQDILAELQPRLRSLERQARRAQEYNQMKADLKVVLLDWYGYHWHRAQADLVAAQVEAKQKEEILTTVQSNQLHLDEKIGSYRSQINELRQNLAEWSKQLSGCHEKREIVNRQQAVTSERLRSLDEQLGQLSSEKLNLDEQAALQKDQLDILRQDIAQLESELEDARRSAAESAAELVSRQQTRAALDEGIQALQKQIADRSTSLTQHQVRSAEKESHLVRLRSTLAKFDKEIATTQVELDDQQKKLSALSQTQKEKTLQAEAAQHELATVQETLASFESQRNELAEKLAGQKVLSAKIQAEIKVLDDAEHNLTGYEEGARILLQAVSEQRLEGAIGALGNILVVPEKFETAIAAILGEYIDSLVLRSLNQSDKALDLIDNETIRGSIFPLDVISASSPLVLDLAKAPVEPEKILGVAANLVKAAAELKPVIDLLFGQVIVVDDRKTARAILASSGWRKTPNLRIVTLKGEMYLSSGPIVRGASRKGLLVRPRQRRESKSVLEESLALENDLEERSASLDKELNKALEEEKACLERRNQALEEEKSVHQQLSHQELEVEKLRRALQWHQEQKARSQADITTEIQDQANLNQEIDQLKAQLQGYQAELSSKTAELSSLPVEELQSQSSYWNTNMAVIEQALRDASNRQRERQAQLEQTEGKQAELISRDAQISQEIKSLQESLDQATIDAREIANEIARLSALVQPAEQQLATLETDHNSLLTTDAEARQVLRSAEQQYTQAKINHARHQEAFETLRGHIEDDFGLVSFDYTDTVSGPKPLPLDGMVEKLPKVEVIAPEIEISIREQKAQIRRMGAINPEAQAEYQEVKARFDFLTSQVDDLQKAEADIREVIAELDALMEREFQRTFDAVAQEFKQIFTRLFGGGSARLALTEPENITDTGIDIETRLPGRREQGLSLLSGGERSLTAAALIFALLRVSPTPFCILDEVDAMLDEANVSRFRDLLTELSEKTQFIVITHNRNTVQAASIIYGITMGRDSASQVISLRMDELGEEFGV